jgi:hypothetical protein
VRPAPFPKTLESQLPTRLLTPLCCIISTLYAVYLSSLRSLSLLFTLYYLDPLRISPSLTPRPAPEPRRLGLALHVEYDALSQGEPPDREWEGNGLAPSHHPMALKFRLQHSRLRPEWEWRLYWLGPVLRFGRGAVINALSSAWWQSNSDTVTLLGPSFACPSAYSAVQTNLIASSTQHILCCPS